MNKPKSYLTLGLVKYFLISELPEAQQADFREWSKGFAQPEGISEDAHYWAVLENFIHAEHNQFSRNQTPFDAEITDDELKQFMQLLVERDDVFSKVKGLARSVIELNANREGDLTPQVRMMAMQLMSELGPRIW